MSDIFISYAREDQQRAEMLAQTLESRGWSIFWDRTIPIGKTWRETIGSELDDARCVIVLWSKISIKSAWVQDEADEAKRRGVFVPVLIENVQPPMGFRSIQAAHLENWDGTESTQAFRRLITDIAAVIRPLPKEAEKEPPSPPRGLSAPQSATPELRQRLEHVSDEQRKEAAASSTAPWFVIAGLGFVVLIMVGIWQYGPRVTPQSAPSLTSQAAPPVTQQPAPPVTSQDANALNTQVNNLLKGLGRAATLQDYAKARDWYEKAAAGATRMPWSTLVCSTKTVRA
jgi:hypothetical protein